MGITPIQGMKMNNPSLLHRRQCKTILFLGWGQYTPLRGIRERDLPIKLLEDLGKIFNQKITINIRSLKGHLLEIFRRCV